MPAPELESTALNISLLERLQAARGDFIAIAELGSDPARVRSDLDALAAFGFAIEHHPYRGVSYVGPAARLCPDQIEYRLSTRLVGRRIAVWDRIGSTNDMATRACESLSNDGLVILAEQQTSGRGSRGRSWIAPPRTSILMSIVLFPPPNLAPAVPEAAFGCAWLTALAAVATAEVVDLWTGRIASIKWPNDVRVQGRKIAGILVERAPSPGARLSTLGLGWAVVIGIGLNVNVERDSLPADLRESATSIQIERTGEAVDRSALARDLIGRLDSWYETCRSRGCDLLNNAWRTRGEHMGKIVRVETPTGRTIGRLVDVDFVHGLTLDLNARSSSEQTAAATADWARLPLSDVLSLNI